VLDPFCGTGTTNLVAMRLGRVSIGIDISEAYISIAEGRCRRL
jgi:DNA modification methylase